MIALFAVPAATVRVAVLQPAAAVALRPLDRAPVRGGDGMVASAQQPIATNVGVQCS